VALRQIEKAESPMKHIHPSRYPGTCLFLALCISRWSINKNKTLRACRCYNGSVPAG
jgi:hypothetical protein